VSNTLENYLNTVLNTFCRSRQVQKRDAIVEGIAAVVHGIVVGGPIVANSASVAKFSAAERGLTTLKDKEHQYSLGRICDCRIPKATATLSPADQGVSDEEEDINEVVSILLG
jgi:hypothetical protein